MPAAGMVGVWLRGPLGSPGASLSALCPCHGLRPHGAHTQKVLRHSCWLGWWLLECSCFSTLRAFWTSRGHSRLLGGLSGPAGDKGGNAGTQQIDVSSEKDMLCKSLVYLMTAQLPRTAWGQKWHLVGDLQLRSREGSFHLKLALRTEWWFSTQARHWPGTSRASLAVPKPVPELGVCWVPLEHRAVGSTPGKVHYPVGYSLIRFLCPCCNEVPETR